MKRLVKKLGLGAVGGCIGLLFAELVLRILGVSFPQPYVPDEHFGWRFQPEFSAWFVKEGRAYVKINRAGWRDVDHDVKKPAETLRVAVLGDSFAEATQVEMNETFWWLLGRRLEACDGHRRQVEVLSFSASGFGTAQELQVLRHEVWQYQPDLVVVAFFAANDFVNNSPQLGTERPRPFFKLEGAGLRLDDSFRQHRDYLKARSAWTQAKVRLINASRLLQAVYEVRTRWNDKRRSQAKQDWEMGVDDRVFRAPADETWSETWTITERLLSTMAAETRQHGAEFFVTLIPSGIQVSPDAEKRRQFAEQNGVSDLLYVEERMAQVGQREQFAVIPLAPRMRAVSEHDHRYFHGFANTQLGVGHFNPDGHRVAAELIAEVICEKLSKSKD